MNTALEKTLENLEALPADEQTVIVERLDEMISRAKIDMKLASAEERGGKTTAQIFFAELKSRYGS